MIVVSDTSPLNYLVLIDAIDVQLSEEKHDDILARLLRR